MGGYTLYGEMLSLVGGLPFLKLSLLSIYKKNVPTDQAKTWMQEFYL